jgi:hypothetical protein
MKKRFTLFFFFFITTPLFIMAQSNEDIARILQKCIDLPELQQNINSFENVYVLQHGVSFPSTINVTKSGKRVQFITKSQLATENIQCYILFWEFKVEANSAKIDFVLNYSDHGTVSKTIHYLVDMVYTGQTWNVTKVKSEER